MNKYAVQFVGRSVFAVSALGRLSVVPGADAQESQEEVLSLVSKFPDADGRLNGVESIWNTRESLAGSEGRFELMEPLLALHGVLLKCIGLRDRLPDVFLRTIIHARKAGNLSASWRALEHLKNFALLEKESECPFLSRYAIPVRNSNSGLC